tara:strand:+ start:4290 stop:6224 length:1935 start_codon:yes stop_codon:yes gene_type:complete
LKQQRVIIENILPQLNCGEFFIKRTVNEIVDITADVIGDGHDVIQAEVCFRHGQDKEWQTVRLQPSINDGYHASFFVDKQGYWQYKIKGWVDQPMNWQHGIRAKVKDGQHVKSELLDGVQYLEGLIAPVERDDEDYLINAIGAFKDEDRYEEAVAIAIEDRLHQLFYEFPTRKLFSESKTLEVYVDREKARFSTWYEFFPRSASAEAGKHGTFKDCERILPRVAAMGFDTLYFPPIHPIGEKNRKGKNNATNAQEGDSGVPWGIGSQYGGHKSIHPELGTEDDLKKLIAKAESLGIEVALDLAFQAAPDHPYLTEHPEWFKKRPDGTMQYAENPPKKYQDIVNFNWDTEAYQELWKELLSVAQHWIALGVKVFRVDNPHTKPYLFWNWFIKEIKKDHADVLFLAEAFSRPRVMQQLAKQGYTQSYTYFTWRTSKHELMEYMTELTQGEMKEYYRPNFWPNTPDINPYHLQGANEAQHLIRYALAATLSSNIGLYGPVYEFMVSDAMPGKEEYLDSEKYQIRHWDWEHENKLIRLIAKINSIRHQEPALQQTNNIRFCEIHNDAMLAFYKHNQDRTHEILVIISLDPYYKQAANVQLPLGELGVQAGERVMVKDLVTDSTYNWYDEWNYVELHPALPFHIFKIYK